MKCIIGSFKDYMVKKTKHVKTNMSSVRVANANVLNFDGRGEGWVSLKTFSVYDQKPKKEGVS